MFFFLLFFSCCNSTYKFDTKKPKNRSSLQHKIKYGCYEFQTKYNTVDYFPNIFTKNTKRFHILYYFLLKYSKVLLSAIIYVRVIKNKHVNLRKIHNFLKIFYNCISRCSCLCL